MLRNNIAECKSKALEVVVANSDPISPLPHPASTKRRKNLQSTNNGPINPICEH